MGKEVGRRKVTRRGGREASVSSRGIGEDERQPMMARLAARSRRFNLVTLVALRKRKPSG